MIDNKLILDGHKLWLLEHRNRLYAWLAGERIVPITIDCALTRACNYNCIYCYSKLQENDVKKMTWDIIARFLDDASEIGVKAVSFVSDGESTCSPYVYDAILRGKKNSLDMALGTTGYLLDNDRLEEILPALTYLRFNISGAEPMSYSKIHGCPPEYFYKVINTIRLAVKIKKKNNLSVTIGLQMVLLPSIFYQVIPLVKLGKELNVDYFIIKHCSDDEHSSLGIDYMQYHDIELIKILMEAETISTDSYSVRIKWSKILEGNNRQYSRCYGPAFMMQFSGSGLVAPCGMLFNNRYKKYHIGNITEKSFKSIWQSDRYMEVLRLLASEMFDAKTMCGSLCLQHTVNKFLNDTKRLPQEKVYKELAIYDEQDSSSIIHRNFI